MDKWSDKPTKNKVGDIILILIGLYLLANVLASGGGRECIDGYEYIEGGRRGVLMEPCD